MGIDVQKDQKEHAQSAPDDEGPAFNYSHPFWKMPEEEVLTVLNCTKSGLTPSEAKDRLSAIGKNEIEEKESHKTLNLILSQILDPVVLILFIAALISYVTGDPITGSIIIAIVVITSAIGFIQEYSSSKAVEKLKKFLTYKTMVLRNNRATILDTNEVVPGDIVMLSVGDRVPADIRLTKADNMSIDESVLTGEYCPAEKTAKMIEEERPIPQDLRNMAFTGGVVRDGRGEGIVVATGKSTFFGKTALDIGTAEDESEFQIQIKKFGKQLLYVILVSIFFVFVVNVYFGHGLVTSLLFAIVLAVGMVPEVFPFIVQILLSEGAAKLAKNGVIVKRLSATEDLGNVDILCCDKTGSLTENRIRVADYFDLGGKKDDTPFVLSLKCNSATVLDHHIHGDPMDVAIREKGKKSRVLTAKAAKYKKVYEIPFDFERRRMSVIVKTNDEHYMLIAKGAPEAILAVSSRAVVNGKVVGIGRMREKISEKYTELSEKGYRTIAVGIKEMRGEQGYSKDSEKDLTFVGFVTFFDPPKKSVRETLELARKGGIKIKILTGDGAAITRAVANKVGFDVSPEQIIVGAQLDEILERNDLDRIENAIIFARMTPDQKFRIVKALKSRGHVVAYLGDGVNDAPPLTAADVGISVDGSTDVAKEASDIVLTKKDLYPIVEGTVLGRGIFANIVKYIRCVLAGNFAQLYTVAIASLFLGFIPMLPVQMLLVNFLTDAPLLAISTDNLDDVELREPRKWDVGQITKNGAILGVLAAVFYLGFVLFITRYSEGVFQSALYLELIVSELVVIISLRTTKPVWLSKPPSLPLIAGILILTVVGVATVFPPIAGAFGFQPMSVELIAITLAVAIAYSIANEAVKIEMFKGLRSNKINEIAVSA